MTSGTAVIHLVQDCEMGCFLMGVVIAVVLAMGFGIGLSFLQRSVDMEFKTDAVRL